MAAGLIAHCNLYHNMVLYVDSSCTICNFKQKVHSSYISGVCSKQTKVSQIMNDSLF